MNTDASMSNLRNVLHQITQILLRTEDHFGELTQAIEDLNRLFLNIAGLDLDSFDHRKDIHLSGGKAIGPVWAALCISDILRTKRFLRGVYLGIKAALAKFPNRPIHVLYAGTGPFATLVIPLTTVFTPAEVRFTFLEVNPESIDYLSKIIAAFQGEEYVREVACCDATTYRVNPKEPIHMVITETMQNALQKEPQVAITLNLAPQMAPGGILIPQNIRIDAALLNPKKNWERMSGTGGVTECYRTLKTIFELNKSTGALNPDSTGPGQMKFPFPQVTVEIPAGSAAEYPQICLLTTIQVYEGEHLNPWECSLTLPKMLMRVAPTVEQSIGEPTARKPISKLGFQYRMNETPGFEVMV